MESGVEPLALMSQLATVITDILAGSYDIMKGLPRRKFFRRQSCKLRFSDGPHVNNKKLINLLSSMVYFFYFLYCFFT